MTVTGSRVPVARTFRQQATGNRQQNGDPMPEITCLRCKQPIDSQVEQCPHCAERVTNFQRTYSSRLIDGKYQILDRLGIGGMGEIFKVRHIHLNELRVIKIMRPNVAADDQGMQRFLQEARTSTMIKHKNLAMLYDFAQLEDRKSTRLNSSHTVISY